MKTLFCSFFLLSAALIFAQEEKITNLDILPESSISIYGDAKVTTFTCLFDIDQLEVSKNISLKKHQQQYLFKDAVLTLKSRGFDCGKKGRNEDFHKMVKTEKYPEMRLTLKRAVLETDKTINATIEIYIAGTTKTYKVPVKISGDEVRRLKGRLTLNIRKFGLKPIKKMFGLIQVQDIIEIRFDLKMTYRQETAMLKNKSMERKFLVSRFLPYKKSGSSLHLQLE